MTLPEAAGIVGFLNLLWWYIIGYKRDLGILNLTAGIVLLGVWAVWMSGR